MAILVVSLFRERSTSKKTKKIYFFFFKERKVQGVTLICTILAQPGLHHTGSHLPGPKQEPICALQMASRMSKKPLPCTTELLSASLAP